jgi:tetratricopeptide (TPR) repeat protein
LYLFALFLLFCCDARWPPLQFAGRMPSPRSIIKTSLDRATILFFLLLGAVLAVYSPVLDGQFIWDDGYLVGENPLFRSPVFGWEVFRHYLYVDSLAVYYRPVQNLSFILDYWLWHDTPFGFHLTNILLHGSSAFLLYCLLRRILPSLIGPDIAPVGRRDWSSKCVAFAIALVWAIHPIHNAAVAYISGRADSLIAFFMLSAWLLYLRSERAPAAPVGGLCEAAREQAHVSSRRPNRDYLQVARLALRLIAFGSVLLGLASKEAGLLWLALFLVWIFGFVPAVSDSSCTAEAGVTRSKRTGIVIFILLAVGAYWLLRQMPGPRPSPDIGSGDPLSTRILLMFRALGDYTGLVFWPARLHMERTLGPMGPYGGLNSWTAALRGEYLSMLGLLALGVLVWGMRSKSPGQKLRVFGAVWFLIGFIPISNLLPLNAQAAEHWIYMPSIGFLLFLAGMILALPAAGQGAMFACVLLAVIPLGIRTAYRSADWADSEKLFKQTALAGGGTQRVHLNLANLSTSKGSLEQGERQLRFTLAHYPDYVPARINLAINLLKQKKEAEAEQLLAFDHDSAVRAAKEYAHSWSAPLNLARLRLTQKRPQEAIAILDEALPLYPMIWELVALKAQIVKQTQGPAAAIAPVQAYVNQRWWHLGASMLLGELRAANQEAETALQAWRNAAQLDIHSSKPLVEMAKLEANRNHLQQALDYQKAALHREPEQASNYLVLATILDHMHRSAESEAALRQAEELRRQSAP